MKVLDMIKRVKFVHVLAVMLIVIAAVMIFYIMTNDDYKDSELRTQAATAVLLAFATGYGYFLNSSNSSDRKTDLLAQSPPIEKKELE